VLVLVLSSFLRVPRVSALVHGVAAAAVLLFVAGRLRLPLCYALALPGRSARRAAPRHRWPTSPPAEAARRAAGHGPVLALARLETGLTGCNNWSDR